LIDKDSLKIKCVGACPNRIAALTMAGVTMTGSHGGGDLIAAIYDAVTDPSRWDEVVKRIVEATKSFSGNLVLQQADAGSLTALYNVDPFFADAYSQTYHKNDPLKTPDWSIAPGEVRACSYTQTDSFRASAYYDEFVRPQGWVDLIATGLVRAPDAFALLVLTRSPDAMWVEAAEWHLLETLAPHLQRAAAIHRLLSRTTATTESLSAAVAAAGFAVFLLTGNCRVLFANPKAEDLVRRQTGLRYERGQLAAATPALTHRLHALARAGSWLARGEGDIGGTLELSRGENCSPLVAHVIPLAANRAAAIFDIDRPAAAVFVVDPAAGLGAHIQRFAGRFGLTVAEARVLAEIIGGDGLLAAAARLKVTEATARTHAQRILAKTGTTRQTELIRRFFETALPGSPACA
jgi:DNA-binding CsgD family transcriptional regulator/PAS domain-containing protein